MFIDVSYCIPNVPLKITLGTDHSQPCLFYLCYPPMIQLSPTQETSINQLYIPCNHHFPWLNHHLPTVFLWHHLVFKNLISGTRRVTEGSSQEMFPPNLFAGSSHEESKGYMIYIYIYIIDYDSIYTLSYSIYVYIMYTYTYDSIFVYIHYLHIYHRLW